VFCRKRRQKDFRNIGFFAKAKQTFFFVKKKAKNFRNSGFFAEAKQIEVFRVFVKKVPLTIDDLCQ